MNELNFNLCGYAVTAVLTAAFTPMAIRFAKTYRIVDMPDARKIHVMPTPRCGGVAVFIISMLSILLAETAGFISLSFQLKTLLLGAFLMFVVGLWDDLRGLSARQKLVFQMCAAMLLCLAGGRVESIDLFGRTWVFGWLFSWTLSVIWLVGLTNAINMIDGLDGLASGLAAITLALLGVTAVGFGYSAMAFCLFSVSGALAGFLVFNGHPAKIFLGDSGSLFLGFLLAGASLQIARDGSLKMYLAPVTALLIPIFDALQVMLHRNLDRRSVFAADQNHFHHRLLRCGHSHQRAVLTIYGLTFIAVLIAMVQSVVSPAIAAAMFTIYFTAIVFVFRHVGAVRFREMIAGLKNNAQHNRQIRYERRHYERIELHFQKADTIGQWWNAACLAAESLGFRGLCFSCQTADQTPFEWVWQHCSAVCDDKTITMAIPIHDPKTKKTHWLRIDTLSEGSFESVGRNLMLFARLIDRYGKMQSNGYEKKLLSALFECGQSSGIQEPDRQEAYETIVA